MTSVALSLLTPQQYEEYAREGGMQNVVAKTYPILLDFTLDPLKVSKICQTDFGCSVRS